MSQESHPPHDWRESGLGQFAGRQPIERCDCANLQTVRHRYSNPIPHSTIFVRSWRNGATKSACSERSTKPAWLLKLGGWTGESGIYAKLFDAHTTMRLDSNWLFFNVEGLSSDPKLETAMSILIANAVASRAGGKTGQPSITVLDECCVPVRFLNTHTRSGPTLPDSTQKKCERVGNQPDSGRLCGNGIPTARAWSGPGILKNASIKSSDNNRGT